MAENTRVYVGNLPFSVTWRELKDIMREAGEVVHADVLLSDNRQSRGCGVVEFATPEAAQNAIDTLTNTEVLGRAIYVREDREPARQYGRQGNGGAAGSAGSRGPRPPLDVNPEAVVFVSNLPYSTNWKDLKDMFGAFGTVVRADVHQTPNGRSKGHGTVIFETPEQAQAAIESLNGTEHIGRQIEVRISRPPSERPARRFANGVNAGTSATAAAPSSSTSSATLNDPFQQASGNGTPTEATGMFVHAGNLPWRTTDDDLIELFQSIAPVQRAQIQLLPDGRSAGTGVVQFVSPAGAAAAIEQLDGYTYGDLKLAVTFARFPPGTQ